MKLKNANPEVWEKYLKHLTEITFEWLKINSLTYLTIGSSCTASFTKEKKPHAEMKNTWMATLYEETGINFINGAVICCGLLELVEMYEKFSKMLDFNSVKRIVVQKPGFTRYPWYSEDRKLYHRNRSIHEYLSLPMSSRKETSINIGKEEAKLLEKLVSLFPNASFAYWNYWLNEYPAISLDYLSGERIVDLKAKELNINCFGTIVPSCEVDNVNIFQTEKGWINKENQKDLHDKGWIMGIKDRHPARKHNILLAEKVKKWINETS